MLSCFVVKNTAYLLVLQTFLLLPLNNFLLISFLNLLIFSTFFGFKSQLSSLLPMLTLLGPCCLTYKMREKNLNCKQGYCSIQWDNICKAQYSAWHQQALGEWCLLGHDFCLRYRKSSLNTFRGIKLNIKKNPQRTKSPFIFSNQDWTRVQNKQSSYFLLFFNSKWFLKNLISEKKPRRRRKHFYGHRWDRHFNGNIIRLRVRKSPWVL